MNRSETRKSSTKAIHYVLLTGSLLLGGCNQDDAQPTAPTQVVATVNDSEISVHQLNHLLSKAKDIPKEHVAEAQRRMLKTLIDQELMMAKAVADKLDRSPEVLLALETARREVLSRAYLEKIANGVAAPTDQEIRTYYDLNPNLFALRSIFNYRELLLPAATPDFAGVAAQIKAGDSIETVASQLTDMGVKYSLNQGSRAAEQTPPDLLAKLSYAKPGETLAVENALGLSFVEITQIQQAPINLESAKPIIANILSNQRRNQAMGDAVENLRKTATITYTDSNLQPQ